MNTTYIECSCSDASHVVRISSDLEDKELVIEVQLQPIYGFFKRIWLAIKYVFGYSNPYGHWDCTLLNRFQVDELIRATLTHKLACEKDEMTEHSEEFFRTLLNHKLKCETEHSAATKIKKALKALTDNDIYTDCNKKRGPLS
jgi:hypothetical protein